jgi:hypothetical protein
MSFDPVSLVGLPPIHRHVIFPRHRELTQNIDGGQQLHCKLLLREVADLRNDGMLVYFEDWHCNIRVHVMVDVVVGTSACDGQLLLGSRSRSDAEDCQVRQCATTRQFAVVQNEGLS